MLVSSWTYGKTTLAHGDHEVNASASLLEALAAAEDAGVVVLRGSGDEIKRARGKIETAEAAMKAQPDRLAKTDPEHWVAHLLWEVESRCARAVGLPDEHADAKVMAEQLALVAPSDDQEPLLPDTRAAQARLLAQAAGIVARIRELGGDEPAAEATRIVVKAREAVGE